MMRVAYRLVVLQSDIGYGVRLRYGTHAGGQMGIV